MDSPEYKKVTQNYPKLVLCIQQSPTGVAIQLKPSGILAQGDWTYITNPQIGDDLKAIRIVDAIQSQVQSDPQKFYPFMSALKAAGPWTKTIFSELTFDKPESASTTLNLLSDTSTEQSPGVGNTLCAESSDSITHAQAALIPSPLSDGLLSQSSGE